MRRAWYRAGICAAVLLSYRTAHAQAGWTTGVMVGRSVYDVPNLEPTSISGLVSARYDAKRPLWLTLDAGVPLAAKSTLWGSAGIGARLQRVRSAATLGIDTGLQLYGFRDPVLDQVGRGVVGELLPRFALTRGGLTAEVRSGVQLHSLALPAMSESRAVHLTEARLGGQSFGAVQLAAETRYLRASEGGYPYLGVQAQRSGDRVEVWGRLGRWTSRALPTAEWGAGVAVRVAPGVVVEAVAEQTAGDPLFLNPPRRGWSLGVRRMPRRHTPPPLPVLPLASDGAVIFRLSADPSTGAPAVAGDFNGWTPVPMERVGTEWRLRLRISPGVYHYAYRRGDGEWFIPESAPGRRDDGMGGVSALLVVP